MPTIAICSPSLLAGVASVLDVFGVLGSTVKRSTARRDRAVVSEDWEEVRGDLERARSNVSWDE